MPHLKTITIQNFQSHKETEIKLHPGVNVIVGESDSGKSAVMRAFGWVKNNRPLGEAFRSTWGGRTLVELEFSDGLVVGRETNQEKVYYVNDDEFKAFKTDVPAEVTKALNFDEVNIQWQMDQPYLLSSSSGDVAKTLNKIANLTIIDRTIANISKMVRVNRENIRNYEDQFERLEEQEKAFSYLPEMEKAVELYEKLTDEHETILNSISILTSICESVSELKAELEEIDLFLQAEEPLTLALTLLEEEKAITAKIFSLYGIVQKVEQLETELITFGYLDSIEVDLKSAFDMNSEYTGIINKFKIIDHIVWKIENDEQEVARYENKILELSNKFNSEFPQNCPLCGSVK